VVTLSGVVAEGVFVDTGKPGLVGGSVEVTNRGETSVAGSCATLIQDDKTKTASRMAILIFFMR
jgi:ABC-type uncharacterized transport system ATPase component